MMTVRFALVAAAALGMFVLAGRRSEWRGGLVALALVFLAGAANEVGDSWRRFIPEMFGEAELIPILAALALSAAYAALNRGTTIAAAAAVYRNRRLPILVWGLVFISVMPNVAKWKPLWNFLASHVEATHDIRELAEEAVRFIGDALLFNWAALFLKDKWRRRARVPSPHEHLVFGNELVEIGRGTRRVAYRVGDTGYCVKFYYPEEQCIEALKMQKSIQRDVRWRRFNKSRNSSSAEVYVYDLMRHTMPEDIRSAMPEVCERVYHPVWGWGILETYYTNPDGSAILPYEDEMKRSSPEDRERIYALAVDVLDRVIAAGALLYEPGNFHVLRKAEGAMEMKLVDFEPESKTAIPLERISVRVRRKKLRRKAKRYLKHIRKIFHMRATSLDLLAAEKAFGVRFAVFEKVTGGHQSRNYRGETEDGRKYLVKFASRKVTERGVAWAADMASPLVPAAGFGGRFGTERKHRCSAFEWRDGRSADPALMTAGETASLVKGYLEFSKALQRVRDIPCPSELPEDGYRTAPVVIHGDMHYRNVLFRDGKVAAFLDFEKMRRGNPSEDLFRYFVHAMERTRFFRFRRLAAMKRNFAAAVRQSPWGREVWLEAVSLYVRRKTRSRAEKSGGGVFKKIERALRAPLYRALGRIVRENKK